MVHFRFSSLVFFVGLVCFIAACSSKRSTTSASAPTLSKAAKTRQLIIKEAEKHKGVPYKYAGKDPKGFDCSGFTYYIYKKHDILLSSSSGAQSKQGQEIPISKAQNGDLLFFGPDGRNGRIQHVGIVYKNTSEGLYMIHSSSKRGIVIDNVSASKYWKPKLLFARKVLSN
jgi:cell wall-associated NlpC family hydrolase